MLQRLAYSAIVIVAAVSAPALLAHLVALPSGASEEVLSASEPRDDDGWRLTKQGWHQLSPRVLPAVPASEAVPPSVPPSLVRWDLHPATLTILLVLGVVCAFFLFPHQAGLRSRHKSESLF